MASLDSFLAHISSQDTKKKLQVGADILNYLSVEDNSLECENLSAFIDSIIHWLNNSNFKVRFGKCHPASTPYQPFLAKAWLEIYIF